MGKKDDKQPATALDSIEDAVVAKTAPAEPPVANVVDTNYTMTAKLPKSLLHGGAAYDGVHDRLRATGQQYLRER